MGHNNYKVGKSVLKVDAQQLLDKFHAGEIVNAQTINSSKIRVNFGKIIGNFVDINTGQSIPTTNTMIIISKTGVHIVPIRP